MQNKNNDEILDDAKFSKFLNRITAFIFAYAITNPGVNALRTPVYDEMIQIINGQDATLSKFKFNEEQARSFFENYLFTNQRTATRSIITWYAYSFSNQKLLSINETFHLEHIYSRKRQDMEHGLKNQKSLDSLGNKILLESDINIKASDYHFEDKKKIYSGEQYRGKNKNSTKIAEITNLIGYTEFEEAQITERTGLILNEFFNFLRREDLIA